MKNATAHRLIAVLAAMFLLFLVLWQNSAGLRAEIRCQKRIIKFYDVFGVNTPRETYFDKSAYWRNARVCLLQKCLSYKRMKSRLGGKLCVVSYEFAPMYNAFRP